MNFLSFCFNTGLLPTGYNINNNIPCFFENRVHRKSVLMCKMQELKNRVL